MEGNNVYDAENTHISGSCGAQGNRETDSYLQQQLVEIK